MTARTPLAISSSAAIRSRLRWSITATSPESRRFTRSFVRLPSRAVPCTCPGSVRRPLRFVRKARARVRRLVVAIAANLRHIHRRFGYAAFSSSSACLLAVLSPRSAPIMRTISATSSSPPTLSTSAVAWPPSTRFSIVKWVSASVAT